MKFYLSGGMEFREDLGGPWRKWISEELNKIGHSGIDPTKLEEDENIKGPTQKYLNELKLKGDVDKVRKIVRNSLFRKDMYGIQLSDATIVLYDRSVQLGAGTLAEVWESFREGRPIYIMSDFPLNKVPGWLIGESTEVFFNFDDLLFYLGKHDQIHADVVAAQKTRDEVLGGIYSAY